MSRFALLLFFFVGFPSFWAKAQEPLRFEVVEQNRQLLVDHLPLQYLEQAKKHPEQIKNFFSVRIQQQSDSLFKVPPILGEYGLVKQQIVFQPILSFQKGMTYVATISGQEPFVFSIALAPSEVPSKVLAIYPSIDQLPANLLKIYLHFSKPMGEGQAYRHIHLLDQHGKKKKDVFLELYPELWDESHQRLTLWLDPGRIKRALGPNQNSGAPILEGQSYQLVIDKNWKDAQGYLMEENGRKKFTVKTPDRKQPSIQNWRYDLPPVASNDPLKIHFGESLDEATALKAFTLEDQSGNPISGQFKLAANETMLLFHPDQNWVRGSYRLRVAAYLEDLAGNNLNRLFDQDLALSKPQKAAQNFYEYSFHL